jgi:hypothetical protein
MFSVMWKMDYKYYLEEPQYAKCLTQSAVSADLSYYAEHHGRD